MGSNNGRNGREMNNFRDHKDKNQKDMVMNLDLKDDQELSVNDDPYAG